MIKNLITAVMVASMPMTQTANTSEYNETYSFTLDNNTSIWNYYSNPLAPNPNDYGYLCVKTTITYSDDYLNIYGTSYEQYNTIRNQTTNQYGINWTYTTNPQKITILRIETFNEFNWRIEDLYGNLTFNRLVYNVEDEITCGGTYKAYYSYNQIWEDYINKQNITGFKDQAINRINNDVFIRFIGDDDLSGGVLGEEVGIGERYTIVSSQELVNRDRYYIIFTEEIDMINIFSLNTTEYTQIINDELHASGTIFVNSVVNREVIDLPGLLFNILTMPFAFISQAFNLTLFPNTPYSVSISNILLGIITALMLIMIIKLIVKFSK